MNTQPFECQTDIKAALEYRFTLKLVHDMIITFRYG